MIIISLMAEPSAERRALLAHPTLQDTDPKTRTYRSFIRRGLGDNPTVLAIASNTGANQVIEKMVEGLPQTVNLTVVAHVRDAEAFRNKNGLTEAHGISPAIRIADTKTDVGIAGFATEPVAEMAMTVDAKYPKVWIQDSASQSSMGFYESNLVGPIAVPDYFFAVNEFGAQQERLALLKAASRIYNPREVDIRVIGDPRDEKYAGWDIPRTNSVVREYYGISTDRKVIFYVGVPGPGCPEALGWVADASVQTGREEHQVVYARHPRGDGDPNKPEEKAARIALYDAAAKPLRKFNGLIDATDFDPKKLGLEGSKVDNLIQMSDLGVTTVSSVAEQLIKARKVSAQILHPDILKGTEIPEFEATPEIKAGAIVNIQSPEDMVRLLSGLEEQDYLTNLQRKMDLFKPEPGATATVVNALLEIANRHRGQKVQGLYT
jgi:hypothetical protein